MTSPFARPLTGDELMDLRTFCELYDSEAERVTRRRTSPPPPAQPASPRLAPRVYDLAELGARVVGGAPASPAAELEAEIDRARSREEVAHLAVHLARRYASAAALLLVHRGLIRGVSAAGLPGHPDALLFSVTAASVFADVADGGRAFRGAPPTHGLDLRILRALGRERAQEIAILPVTLPGRVVSLLYADGGSEPLGDASIAALSAVCRRVSAAWERLIRERKRSTRA